MFPHTLHNPKPPYRMPHKSGAVRELLLGKIRKNVREKVETSGSHGGEYEDGFLRSCCAV
jgi:hypothetical protein